MVLPTPNSDTIWNNLSITSAAEGNTCIELIPSKACLWMEKYLLQDIIKYMSPINDVWFDYPTRYKKLIKYPTARSNVYMYWNVLLF